MTAYAHDSGYNARRATVFVVIVGLHLLLGWAFVSGFAVKVAKMVAPDVIAKIIEEPKPKETPPPPPPVQLDKPPPVQIIDPVVQINVPVDLPPPVAVTTTQPVPPQPPRPAPVAIGTPMQATYAPDPQQFYPAMSQQLGEEGRPIIHFCVAANGKTSTVLKTSSGIERLDEAAVKYGNALRYKPAMAEGKPIDQCKDFAVKFVIKK
ncbi:MAG TPA: energy transducer TonB [Steroidobacteraceae bacterium]|nr:energy transducer TonB [Steroidobacteraceae bacterium]